MSRLLKLCSLATTLWHCHVLTLVPFLCLCVRLVRAWVGVGSLCPFFYVVFLCVWPSMVLNQRQVSFVVSDWESYLGSLFSPFWLWVVNFCLVSVHLAELFCFRFVVILCSVQFLQLNYDQHLPCCILVRSFLLLLRWRGISLQT